jgi:hypothetical protein
MHVSLVLDLTTRSALSSSRSSEKVRSFSQPQIASLQSVEIEARNWNSPLVKHVLTCLILGNLVLIMDN